MLKLQSSSDLSPIRGSEYEIMLCLAGMELKRDAVLAEQYETLQTSARSAIATITLTLGNGDQNTIDCK